MKPEDARKLADELAGRNIESVGMLSRNERDQIVTALRTLADRVHRLERDLLEAMHQFSHIVDSARIGEDDARSTLREGGAQ